MSTATSTETQESIIQPGQDHPGHADKLQEQIAQALQIPKSTVQPPADSITGSSEADQFPNAMEQIEQLGEVVAHNTPQLVTPVSPVRTEPSSSFADLVKERIAEQNPHGVIVET